jgi:hypothetical protein
MYLRCTFIGFYDLGVDAFPLCISLVIRKSLANARFGAAAAVRGLLNQETSVARPSNIGWGSWAADSPATAVVSHSQIVILPPTSFRQLHRP